ncbi:MAG TPA: MobA/MobL family protein [Candidatus Competibacter phosphatis]|nr:MobA/MobL family protein [Candidatus Competibacter phosphatis]
MAIYHLSVKPISRGAGRSATGAAAYRAGACIYDERTGLNFDYTHKAGVLHSELILPGGNSTDRAEFWNALEHHHKRQDAIVAREVEMALPSEFSPEQRQELAVGFARELADRYGVAADVALHAPRPISDAEIERNPHQHHDIDPELGRHNGNWHVHILLSACRVSPQGELGRKAVELDPIHCQRHHLENLAERERAHWAERANRALERAGHEAQLDPRGHAERGFAHEPTQHLGPAAAGYERRTGQPSHKRLNHEQDAGEAQARREELSGLEDEWQQVHRALRYAQGQTVDGPILEIDRAEIERGMTAAAAQYHDWQQQEALREQAQAQYQQWRAEQERQQQAEREQEQERQRERQAEQERQQAELVQTWLQQAEELQRQAEHQHQQQHDFQQGM